jgi:hypothetical protein
VPPGSISSAPTDYCGIGIGGGPDPFHQTDATLLNQVTGLGGITFAVDRVAQRIAAPEAIQQARPFGGAQLLHNRAMLT